MANENEVRELANLLQQALDSTVVRERHQGSRISIGEYRSIVASGWLSFDPDPFRAYQARVFRPVIQDSAIQERLLNLIRDALRQYIHNDTLQSAIIVTGGLMDGFHIDHLVSHLMSMTLAQGSEYAAQSFYECVQKASVDMQFITLIDGVKVMNTIEVGDGIRLVSVPNNPRDFPSCMINPALGYDYTVYFGKTLIIVDEVVSPVFANPDQISPGSPLPFKRSSASTDHPDFVPAEFCEALSMSVNHIVQHVAWWTYYRPDEAYAVETIGRSPAYIESMLHRTRDCCEVTSADIQEAMDVYETRRSLNDNVARRLRVPIDRWIKSKMDDDPVDAFINLGIALESLYLGQKGDTGELTYRLSLRAAWHLGNDAQERHSLRREFAKIYDLRSRAVHTGVLREKDNSPELIARARNLCLESIMKIIRNGKFPDWDQLVMGSM